MAENYQSTNRQDFFLNEATSIWEQMIYRSTCGETYNEFQLKCMDAMELESKLASTLGFGKILINTPYDSAPDLLAPLYKDLLANVANTRSLANIVLLLDGKVIQTKSFFKKEIEKCHSRKELQSLFSRLHIWVFCEDSKFESSAFFSVLTFYFASLIKSVSIACTDFGFILNDAVRYARTARMGPPTKFIERLKVYDYAVKKVCDRGLLQTSLFRHYMDGTDLRLNPLCKNSVISAQKNTLHLSKLMKDNDEMGVNIDLAEINGSSSFIVRSPDYIVLARKIIHTEKGKQEYSCFRLPISDEIMKLKFSAINVV